MCNPTFAEVLSALEAAEQAFANLRRLLGQAGEDKEKLTAIGLQCVENNLTVIGSMQVVDAWTKNTLAPLLGVGKAVEN